MDNKFEKLEEVKTDSTGELEDRERDLVLSEGPLKQMIVDYVGDQKKPEDNQVTLEMIVETMAKEFPEVVLAVAEENFIRGYRQAIEDAEAIKDATQQVQSTETDEQAS